MLIALLKLGMAVFLGMPDNFEQEKRDNIIKLGAHPKLRKEAIAWLDEAARFKYSYHFSWLGLPIIQLPTDIIAIQEIIWEVKPDLIIETGIARGGSLIFYASMLQLLGGGGRVIGIDVDIRSHNRTAIESHPMFKRIEMLEGSSVDLGIVDRVSNAARGKRVLVVLDSNHTHAHVLKEIELYSPLVRAGSYLIVLDTSVEDMAPELCKDRPWGPGNSPKTAVHEFLKKNPRFVIDTDRHNKLLFTVAPDGYLKCVKDQ